MSMKWPTTFVTDDGARTSNEIKGRITPLQRPASLFTPF